MTTSDSDTAYDAALGAVRRLGAERARAIKRLELADEVLADAVIEADKAGVPRRTIGNEAGLARATVYLILERRGAHVRAQDPLAEAAELADEVAR